MNTYENPHHPSSRELAKQIEGDMYAGNIDKIKTVLNTPNYLGMTQDEKEKEVFFILANMINNFRQGYEVLSYLVEDYKISDDNSINSIHPNDRKLLEPIFTARALSNELNDNSSSTRKKPKL